MPSYMRRSLCGSATSLSPAGSDSNSVLDSSDSSPSVHIPVGRPPNPFERRIDDRGESGAGPIIRKVVFPRNAERNTGGGISWTTGRQASIPFEDAENVDDISFAAETDPFGDEDMFRNGRADDEVFEEERADRPVRESTITIAERAAFQRIFADIMARSQASDHGSSQAFDQDSASNRHTSNDPPSVAAAPGVRRRRTEENPDSIQSKAMRGSPGKRGSSQSRKTKTQEELRADVNQYPLPLRAAAARAIGLVTDRSVQPPEVELTTNVDEWEQIRKPERERVEALMRAAETDVDLWRVMEQEVFSLVERLGLGDKPVKKPPAKKKKGKSSENASQDENEMMNSSTATSLDLTTYGPLYPSHLLLGLRLLDRSFTKPSPLVLNILPRIKSLGIISHVLGASTSLYNELLRIYGSRYDNFQGALKLLEEMEQGGLDFDAETLSIVHEINGMQFRAVRGDKGPVVQALWSLPEFAPGKFRVWRERIRVAMEDRGSEGSDEGGWAG